MAITGTEWKHLTENNMNSKQKKLIVPNMKNK